MSKREMLPPKLDCDRVSQIYLAPDEADAVTVIEITDAVGPYEDFNTYAWVHQDMPQLARDIAHIPDLLRQVEDLRAALGDMVVYAHQVVVNWEQGDLVRAVRELREVKERIEREVFQIGVSRSAGD